MLLLLLRRALFWTGLIILGVAVIPIIELSKICKKSRKKLEWGFHFFLRRRSCHERSLGYFLQTWRKKRFWVKVTWTEWLDIHWNDFFCRRNQNRFTKAVFPSEISNYIFVYFRGKKVKCSVRSSLLQSKKIRTLSYSISYSLTLSQARSLSLSLSLSLSRTHTHTTTQSCEHTLPRTATH